jgi:inorganic pyrophosphatase
MDYKSNENKEVVVEDFLGAAEAHRVIKEAMDLYTDLFVPKRQRH